MASKKYRMKFFLDDGRSKYVEFEVPSGECEGEHSKPIKGVDYFTREDKDEIIKEVLENLPESVPGSVPEYTGEYHVIPSTSEDVVMETANKIMNADVRVKKIPFAEVTNTANGKTVTIG